MDDFTEEEVEDEQDLGLRGCVKRAVRWIIRTIRDFKQLLDVSIVTNPAYPGTSVDARSLELVSAECRSRVEAMCKPGRNRMKELHAAVTRVCTCLGST